MPISSLYTCSRCRKEYEFRNIRYNEEGVLVCVSCLKITAKEAKKGTGSGSDQPEVLNLICAHCRYKFRFKQGSAKTAKCPYCGKTNLMLIKKYKDEDDLIKDSMDPKFDI